MINNDNNCTKYLRLAMKHGVSLVPAFSFNESSTYDQFAVDNATVSYVKVSYN